MSQADLKAMIEETSVVVGERFAEVGEITPTWVALTKDGEHFVLPSPPVDKDTAAFLVRKYFELRGVVAYVFFDEAWGIEGAVGEKEKMTKFAETHSLEHYPGRVELVIFSAEDMDGSLLARRPIIRPKHAKAYLGDLVIEEYVKATEGRLVNLLRRVQ